jgi:hypothetical protein
VVGALLLAARRWVVEFMKIAEANGFDPSELLKTVFSAKQ